MSITVHINVDRAAAIRLGKDQWGWLPVEIDPTQLAQEERDALAALKDYRTSPESWQFRLPQDWSNELQRRSYNSPGEATADTLRDCLRQVMAWRVDVAADAAKREAAERAKAEAILAQVWPAYECDGVKALLTQRDQIHWLVDHNEVVTTAYIDSHLGDALAWLHHDVWEQAIAACDAQIAADVERAKSAVVAKREAEAKAKAEIAAKEETERLAWITAHGSPRLKRLIAEDIEHEAVYLGERLALERPGWSYDDDRCGEANEVRNARQEGLDLLDEGRKTAPDAKLVWWVIEHEHDGCEDDGDCPKTDWKGYACTAEFLGKDIVFGVPSEYAC